MYILYYPTHVLVFINICFEIQGASILFSTMQTELQQWWGQTADIGYGGIFVLLLLQSYSMGRFHSAVGWSQFLRQQNYYWREKLWRVHEDLLFICSFGSYFAILHMVSMTFSSFGIILKEDCRPWRPAQRCRLHWDGSAIFSHDNLFSSQVLLEILEEQLVTLSR